MKLIGKYRQDAESAAGKTEAEKTLPKDGILLNEQDLSAVSGGCGVVKILIGEPQCDCSGENVNMLVIGTDDSGRITYYQCPLCGATENVYG